MEVRPRMTERITTARLKLEARRAVGPLMVFLIGVAVTLVCALWLVSNLSNTFGKGTYEVRFEIDNAYGILEGVDEVRYRGIPAGTIEKLERRGSQVVLVAAIRKRYGPIYRNAKAELRPITPLNDMYFDITDPGTKSAGRASSDEPLAERGSQTSVHIDDVLNVLQANERTRLATLFDQLGNGLDDRGMALRRAFVQLIPFLEGAGKLTDALAARSEATKRLIHNTAILTGELGTRDAELRTLMSAGSAALGTLHQGSGDLDATLRELPPLMREIDTSLPVVRGVLGDVDRGVQSLDPVADRLPAGLRELRRTNAALAPAARRLRAPVRDLVGLSRALEPATAQLDRTATALLPELPSLTRTVKAVDDCKRPMNNFWQWNASLSKFGDSHGPVPRGLAALHVPDTNLPGAPLRAGVKHCVPVAPLSGRPAKPEEGR